MRDSSQAATDGGADAVAEFWHPEIDWRAIEGALDDVGEMPGVQAVRRYVQDWLDTFENITLVAEELLDLGDDRVVALQHRRAAHGWGSRVSELRYAGRVPPSAKGRSCAAGEYFERAEALESVGLAE